MFMYAHIRSEVRQLNTQRLMKLPDIITQVVVGYTNREFYYSFRTNNLFKH